MEVPEGVGINNSIEDWMTPEMAQGRFAGSYPSPGVSIPGICVFEENTYGHCWDI